MRQSKSLKFFCGTDLATALRQPLSPPGPPPRSVHALRQGRRLGQCMPSARAAASVSARPPPGAMPRGQDLTAARPRPRLPACCRGKKLYVGQNATRPPPCMRWRGPCFGLATLNRPVAQPPQRCAPPAKARHPCDTPVSRSIGTSAEVALSWCPFPTVKVFLRPLRVVAQGSAAVHFKFLPYPHDVHKPRPLIRTFPQLSTGLCTRNPHAT